MQTKKLVQSEFIVKITDIMKEYPDILQWAQNGTQLYLTNIDLFCEKVLPQYFRHTNFNSFIRQLNIYNFNKTKKMGKSISFKNQIFKKGNETNFYLIQRKRKFKDLQNFQQRFEKECQNLIVQVNNNGQLTAQVKEVIINLLEYKYVSMVNLKRMKCELQALHKEVRESRSKKVQEVACELKKSFIASINQLIVESKRIDEFVAQNMMKSREPSQTKESLEPIGNQIFYGRYVDQAFQINQSASTVKDEQKQKYVNQGTRQNLRSYNSFHVFLEQFKTRKEQSSFEQKLYHPFNSHNSFMFLPSYIAGPSQLSYDIRFNGQYQSMMNENAESSQKYGTFDNYDQSASISFVQNFDDQNNQVFN